MKYPTPQQAKWAFQSFQFTVEFYRESMIDGLADFTPMLDLLRHIQDSPSFDYLSIYKSLYNLTVASAAHVEKPFILNPNVPCLSIAQFNNEFEFGTYSGKRRKCAFDDATDVLDNQLVMLAMLCAEFDNSNAE